MREHVHAHPCSFCKLNVTFFNDLHGNKLEIIASKFYCIYTFGNNFNNALHTILMHGSAAPSISKKLCDELL